MKLKFNSLFVLLLALTLPTAAHASKWSCSAYLLGLFSKSETSEVSLPEIDVQRSDVDFEFDLFNKPAPNTVLEADDDLETIIEKMSEGIRGLQSILQILHDHMTTLPEAQVVSGVSVDFVFMMLALDSLEARGDKITDLLKISEAGSMDSFMNTINAYIDDKG